ncbi:LrgB family protein [Clostridia bacterium]|nr:LrgB family protein [Clostridia bacterium]
MITSNIITALIALAGILVTIAVYITGQKLYNRYKIDILTPNIFSIVIIVLIMLLFRIDYTFYKPATDSINFFLKPSVVILALPLHRRLPHLLQNKIPILVGIMSGVLVSSISLVGLTFLLKYDLRTIVSLLPKCITTPMGIEVSTSMGAIVPITVLSILVSGISGTVLAKTILRLGGIENPIAKGVAIGTSSHVLGTSKALEIGETEGAISGLALAIAGLVSVFYLPLVAYLLYLI